MPESNQSISSAADLTSFFKEIASGGEVWMSYYLKALSLMVNGKEHPETDADLFRLVSCSFGTKKRAANEVKRNVAKKVKPDLGSMLSKGSVYGWYDTFLIIMSQAGNTPVNIVVTDDKDVESVRTGVENMVLEISPLGDKAVKWTSHTVMKADGRKTIVISSPSNPAPEGVEFKRKVTYVRTEEGHEFFAYQPAHTIIAS